MSNPDEFAYEEPTATEASPPAQDNEGAAEYVFWNELYAELCKQSPKASPPITTVAIEALVADKLKSLKP